MPTFSGYEKADKYTDKSIRYTVAPVFLSLERLNKETPPGYHLNGVYLSDYSPM